MVRTLLFKRTRIGRSCVRLAVLLLLGLHAMPGAADETQLYVVGPNDVLTITVYNQPQLSGKYTVEADSTFSFPLLGRVKVGGLSLRDIESELRTRLARGYLNDPQVSVAIDQYRNQQIFVMGEVRRPGGIPLAGATTITVIEALARAGSTTDQAGPEAIIVRPPDSSSARGPATGQAPGGSQDAEVIRVNLQRLQTGTLSQNVPLRPGDTIFVPRAQTVFVSGRVKSPGEYVIRKSLTVRQAIALAGGETERGSTRRVQILRQVDGGETTIDASLEDIVQPGDTIVVRERFF